MQKSKSNFKICFEKYLCLSLQLFFCHFSFFLYFLRPLQSVTNCWARIGLDSGPGQQQVDEAERGHLNRSEQHDDEDQFCSAHLTEENWANASFVKTKTTFVLSLIVK